MREKKKCLPCEKNIKRVSIVNKAVQMPIQKEIQSLFKRKKK